MRKGNNIKTKYAWIKHHTQYIRKEGTKRSLEIISIQRISNLYLPNKPRGTAHPANFGNCTAASPARFWAILTSGIRVMTFKKFNFFNIFYNYNEKVEIKPSEIIKSIVIIVALSARMKQTITTSFEISWQENSPLKDW